MEEPGGVDLALVDELVVEPVVELGGSLDTRRDRELDIGLI